MTNIKYIIKRIEWGAAFQSTVRLAEKNMSLHTSTEYSEKARNLAQTVRPI